MIKKIILVTALISGISFLYAADTPDTGITSAQKVFIIPIEQNAKNPNPNSFDKIVFKSLYTFISIIPSIDVPDENKLQNYFWMSSILFKWDRMTSESVPPQILDADYIIYGDYEYLDSKKEKVKISLSIWNKKENKNIFTNSYKTTSGVEIFDSIDGMLADIIKGVLKIDFTVSRIKFAVNAGAGEYDVFINSRKIDTYSGGSYNKSMSVLGNQKYHVRIVRKLDGKVLVDTEQLLKQSEVFNVNYTASGSVAVNGVAFKMPGKTYTLLLDDQAVPEGFTTNLSALNKHFFKVSDQLSNTVYTTNFEVLDEGRVSLKPGEPFPGMWHFKAYALGSSFGGLEAQAFLTRNLYIAPGVGFSFINNAYLKQNIYDFSLYCDTGFYILGDMSQDWRAGAGASGLFNLYYPFNAFENLDAEMIPGKNINPYSIASGLFLFGEWKWVTIKLGLYYDLSAGSFYFSPSAGIKF